MKRVQGCVSATPAGIQLAHQSSIILIQTQIAANRRHTGQHLESSKVQPVILVSGSLKQHILNGSIDLHCSKHRTAPQN